MHGAFSCTWISLLIEKEILKDKADLWFRSTFGITSIAELAEVVGFEPTHDFRHLSVFKTVPLDHLGTPP